MTTTAFDRITDALSSRGSNIKVSGNRAMAQCPAHEDRTPSLSLTGTDGMTLVYCHAGCHTDDILAALNLNPRDLYDDSKDGIRYRYDNGRIVWRSVDKKFTQVEGGKLPQQLYHLSRLLTATDGSIFLVEGEKDVHAIESAGGIATCNPMGSSSFGKVDVEPLRGRVVAVVVDKDGAGDSWASVVADRLKGVALQVRFVQAAVGKDAADHVAAAEIGQELHGWIPYRSGALDFKDDAMLAAMRRGFKSSIMRRSELRNLPPVEPLIEGVVSRRSTVVLVGPTGAGKTFVALSWACSIATGVPWLGRKVHRSPVLYVVGEGAYGLDKRITAWERAWRQPVSDDDLIFSVRPESLSDMNTWVEMRAEARGYGCGFVCLDTFSSLAPDADETKDAATIMRRLADLAADIDGTAMLVHHPGWGDESRTRGGYQLEANVDEVVLLRGNAQSPNVLMERKKVKEGVAGARMWLQRKAAHGSVVIEAAAGEGQADTDTADRVLVAVFGTNVFSKAEIRDVLIERLEQSRSCAYETITRLEATKRIERIGGTDRSPTYRLA